MKKLVYATSVAALLAVAIAGCKKNDATAVDQSLLSADEKALIASAGFNSNWSYKMEDGSYLIEGDILLTAAQLQQMSGVAPGKEIIVANEEHYRTTELVNTNGGVRTISVSLTGSFPSHYSAGLDLTIAQYNAIQGSNIRFQRVTSGAEITITAARLNGGPGCILGQSAGFPSGGNPAPGFKLSNTKCATSYMNTASKVQEVMAHEIGHAIGFRHTDYMNRSSCGQNSNEGTAGVGAIHIDGTPETVTGSYNSWMMACTNGDPVMTSVDLLAISTVY